MKTKQPNPTWLMIKVLFLVAALVGVFWARNSLMETAEKTAEDPMAPIPAKVEFGK